MGIEENKEVVRKLVEGMGEGNSSVIDELTTDNFVFHVLNFDIDMDKNTLKQQNEGGHAGIPDYSMTIDEIVAEDDKVMVWSTRRGTHSENFLGVPPTGNKLKIYRFAVYRIKEGKIIEMWALDDMLSQFQQLGILPSSDEIRESIAKKYQ